MVAKKKYPALGKGLGSLIDTNVVVRTSGSSSIHEVDIQQIMPNPNQPRQEFEPTALEELATSIREYGIIQPITLRQQENGKYEIISGERRWRASQLAGLTALPAYIRTADDEAMMEMALVENIQRQDLNPIEIALAYQKLIEQHRLTQEELSAKVGKNRATVANSLRLLKLAASVQLSLQNKELDPGHARALLGLKNPALQVKLAAETVQKGLSVRQVEEMVQSLNAGGSVSTGGKSIKGKAKTLGAEYDALRERLSKALNTKVQMTCTQTGKGKISISFANEEELLRLMALIEKKL